MSFFFFLNNGYLLTTFFLININMYRNNGLLCCGDSGRSEVRVRQPEGVELRVAPVVPQQLLLQEAHGVQREHDGLVLQQTVDVQAWWGRWGDEIEIKIRWAGGLKLKATLLFCKPHSITVSVFCLVGLS